MAGFRTNEDVQVKGTRGPDVQGSGMLFLTAITKFKGLRLTAGRRPTWVCGAYVTPMLALVGPILSKVKLFGAHPGPTHVEPMLAYVRPMLA